MAGPRPRQADGWVRVAVDGHQLAVLRLPLGVGDRDGDRRSERLPVADPGDDLEGVGLEALASAAAVAVPPPRQLVGDLLRADGDARRQPLEDRDEALAVRFTGREQAKHAPMIVNARSPTARSRADEGCGGGPWATPAYRRPLPPWAGRRACPASTSTG